VGGSILLEGRDLLGMSRSQIGAVRGKEIAMIFQEPMTSLNPVFTIGDQIVEAIRTHESVTKKAARSHAVEMLNRVGIPDPHKLIDAYPHRLSGGMRQRAMIAMALSCRPKLLIADEPTTALDVTVQAQIMALLHELQRDLNMGLLLITHNLGVVAQVAQKVIVMYAGRKVEEGTTEDIFKHPLHPYTRGLLASMPRPPEVTGKETTKLNEIPGVVPTLFQVPNGCAFRARCTVEGSGCRDQKLPCRPVSKTHSVACLTTDSNGITAK
jgi:peptide/nickel transport system ATP-binding protein